MPLEMRAWLAAVLLSSAIAPIVACSPNSVCKLMAGINDPSNRTMRRNIMSFGLGQFCKQLTSHNAPLKLTPDANVIGRFYPQHCTQQTLDNGDLWVQFDGMGYAYTNMSRKVSFTSGATIQYNDDFKCAEDNSIYAYFDTRTVSPPQFNVQQIEQPIANLMQNFIGPFANTFGTQMVSGQLGQGFTVIQGDDNSTDFAVGHLPVGQKPPHPFDAHGSNRIMVESLRTEVWPGERDFIGPIEVQDSGRALYLLLQLDGQQSVNVMLFPKAVGDQALQLYVNYGPVGPLPAMPQFSDVLQYGVQYQRAVPVPPGMYYVVIDDTTTAPGGQPAPTAALPFGVGAQAAVVSYAIQIGDAP
jgi:hypothetical protein